MPKSSFLPVNEVDWIVFSDFGIFGSISLWKRNLRFRHKAERLCARQA
jgi:hypothetical protein